MPNMDTECGNRMLVTSQQDHCALPVVIFKKETNLTNVLYVSLITPHMHIPEILKMI